MPDSEPFEEWAFAHRADFRRQALQALESLTADHLQQANYDEAEQLARRQLEIDNLRDLTQDDRPPVEQADVDRDTDAILEMIGEETYVTAYAEGKTMTMEQAITEALKIEIA